MAAEFGPLVSGDWLSSHREAVRVVDVRWYIDGRSGAGAFGTGHIPGAIWLDVDRDLSEAPTTADGRHPLATPERFANALGRAGIAQGTPVVAYDDAGGSIAARLWWMLHVLGEPVAVLDGGLAAWPGELTTRVEAFTSVARAAVPWPPDRFRSADWVASAIAAKSVTILDARAEQRYVAGDPAVDPRPGHIPTAISAPWMDNLEASGRFLSQAELKVRYEQVGEGPAVAYCGSGVTACHDLLALAVAGVSDTALYPGSFSQWGNNPARPVESS